MLTRKQLTIFIAGAALAGLGTASLAVDEANDPYWHKKPQASTPSTKPAGMTASRDKAASKPGYEKSRAGQAEAELLRGPQHLQDKHNT